MAKRLIWSPVAREIRKEILQYWILRNKSKRYSQKLNILFENSRQNRIRKKNEKGQDSVSKVRMIEKRLESRQESHMSFLTIQE